MPSQRTEIILVIAIKNFERLSIDIKNVSAYSIQKDHSTGDVFHVIQSKLVEQFRILDSSINFRLDLLLVFYRRMNKLISTQTDTFFRQFHIIRHHHKRNLEFSLLASKFLNNLEAINFRKSGINQGKRDFVTVLQQNIEDLFTIISQHHVVIRPQDFF